MLRVRHGIAETQEAGEGGREPGTLAPGRPFGGLELTAQELRDLKEVFELMDTDKGGTLGGDEVGG